MLRFLGHMPGGDHSSLGRVRKPAGPLGPPSPSGVLPTPASYVGQPFGVPGVYEASTRLLQGSGEVLLRPHLRRTPNGGEIGYIFIYSNT